MRPQSRRAVVAAAGGERRLVEGLDRGAVGRPEADMAVECGAAGRVADPERQRLLLQRMRLVAAIARGVDQVEQAAIAQGRQRRVVEGAAALQIADADGEMVDHRPKPPPPPGSKAPMPWRISPFFPSLFIFFIMLAMSWNCFRRRLISGTVVPDPVAMRRRREPFSSFGFLRSALVIDEMIASWRLIMPSSILASPS